MQRRGDHWHCSPCFARPQICAACGQKRQVAYRMSGTEPPHFFGTFGDFFYLPEGQFFINILLHFIAGLDVQRDFC